MRRGKDRRLVGLSVALLMAGCAPATTVMIERMAPPEADVSGLDEVAVLPFSSAGPAPQYAREAGARLISVLSSTRRYRVVKAREVARILKEAGINYSYPPDAPMVRRIGNTLGVDAVIYGEVEKFQFREESGIVKVKRKVWTGRYVRDKHGDIVTDRDKSGEAVPRKLLRKRLVENNRLERYAALRISYRMADAFHGNVIWTDSESESASWVGTGAGEIAQLPGKDVIFDLLLDRATKGFVRQIAPHPVKEKRALERGVFHSTRLGVELAKNDLWDEAVEKWIQATKSAPDDPAAYYNLGVAFEQRGLFDLAGKAYENALVRRPHSRRYVKAVAHIKKLIKDLQ